MKRLIFDTPCTWSDGHKIFRFDCGSVTVPDACADWAIPLGLAKPGKQPKPKKREDDK